MPFQFTFNGLLKVAFQGSRVTSDAGLILVRELHEHLGLEALISEHLHDSRQGLNAQFRLADLLRQSVYSRLAGYEDLNDAQRLSTDPHVPPDRLAEDLGPRRGTDVHPALVRDRAADPWGQPRRVDGGEPRHDRTDRDGVRLRHDELDAGQLRVLCAALRRHAPTHPEARRCVAYGTHHRARMRYPTFRTQGLCVSSGVVEAGCKVAIGTRLKRTGMHWTVAGADAIIALRCCRLSGRFEDFWERRSTGTRAGAA